MSDELFKQQLLNFLSDEHNDIIAIKGAWGAGKTYAWNHYLKKAKEADNIHLKRYAYVSLYGLNSIEDLRRAIFESVIDVDLIGDNFSVVNILCNPVIYIGTLLRKWGRLFASFLGLTPFAGVSLETLASTSNNIILRRATICLDDLERRGNSLSLDEVFGLANHLRESRDCRVAIIFNDAKLSLDENYYSLIEKTIDREITFNPIPKEACKIAFENVTPSLRESLTEICVNLGSNNIRILKKTAKNTKLLLENIGDSEPAPVVLKKLLSTIALQTYCYYNAGTEAIPNWEIFKDLDFNTLTSLTPPKTTNERRSSDFLLSQNYSSTGPMESAIAHIVEMGIPPSSLHECLRSYQESIITLEIEKETHQFYQSIHSNNTAAILLAENIFEIYRGKLKAEDIWNLIYLSMQMEFTEIIIPLLKSWILENPSIDIANHLGEAVISWHRQRHPEIVDLIESTRRSTQASSMQFEDAITELLREKSRPEYDEIIKICASGSISDFENFIANSNQQLPYLFSKLAKLDLLYPDDTDAESIALNFARAVDNLINRFAINAPLREASTDFKEHLDRLATKRRNINDCDTISDP